MIAWALSFLGGFGLRAKLYALAILSLLAAFGYLYLRWKMAASRLASAQSKADRLEETRKLEQRIAAGQESLKARQEKVREQILSRKERDHFSHQ